MTTALLKYLELVPLVYAFKRSRIVSSVTEICCLILFNNVDASSVTCPSFSIETNNFLLISGRLSNLATSSNNTSNLILLSAKSLKKRLTSFVALKTRPIAANSLLLRVPPISNLFKKLLMEIRFGTGIPPLIRKMSAPSLVCASELEISS